VQSLLAVTQPEFLLRWFASVRKPDNDLKRAAFLAFQIKSGRLLPDLDDTTKAILDDVLPKELRLVPLLPSETLATRLPLPSPDDTNKDYAKRLSTALPQVRKIRKAMVGDLKGKPREIQLRILTTAQSMETKTADAIEAGPIPPGLTAEERARHLIGIKKLANEFREYALKFENAAVKVREREPASASTATSVSTSAFASESGTGTSLGLPPLHMAMWPWPEHPSTPIIRDLANSGRLAAALIALDLLKTAKRLSSDDHIALRAGALLTASRSEAMQHSVYRELKAEKKESLWH